MANKRYLLMDSLLCVSIETLQGNNGVRARKLTMQRILTEKTVINILKRAPFPHTFLSKQATSLPPIQLLVSRLISVTGCRNTGIHGAAIKKPDCFYDSFPVTSMTKRRVGHLPVDFPLPSHKVSFTRIG
jgi:hypothetical protein